MRKMPNTDASDKLSIVTPTLNRWEFMARTICYYRDTGFRGHLIIGDSSKNEDFDKVRDAIAEVGSAFRVTHVHCPDMGTLATLQRINGMIDTPYAVYCGDDDYLVPEAAARCVVFLDAHPDYMAAQGRGRTLVLTGSDVGGQIERSEPYATRGFEHDTAQMRFTWHMLNYTVTIFAIHRTEIWKRMWSPVENMADQSFAAELLPSGRSVVAGKLKLLNDYYLIRQSHPSTYLLPGFLDWVSSPCWAPSYLAFVDSLAGDIAQTDGTDRAQAERLVKTLFHSYLYANPGSVTYRLQRIRMSAVTFAIPAVAALARKMFPGGGKVFQRVVIRSIAAPFYAITIAARFPNWLMKKLDRINGAIKDRTHPGYIRARRAAEKGVLKRLETDG